MEVDRPPFAFLRSSLIALIPSLARLRDTDGGGHEAAQQIAFADRILLNKIDLVSPVQLALVEARVRRINPLAPIVRTCKSEVRRQHRDPSCVCVHVCVRMCVCARTHTCCRRRAECQKAT